MTERDRLLTKLLNLLRLAKNNANQHEASAAKQAAAKIKSRLASEYRMSDQEVLDWIENQDVHQAEEARPPSSDAKAQAPSPTPNGFETFLAGIFGKSFFRDFPWKSAEKIPSNNVYKPAEANENGPRRIQKGLWIWSVQLNEFWQRSLFEYACKRAGCTFFAKTLLDVNIISCSSKDALTAFGLYQIMESRCGEVGNRRYGRMLKYVDGSGFLQGLLRNGQKILQNIYFAGMASGVEVLRQTHNIDDQYELLKERTAEAVRRWEAWNQQE